MKIHLTVKQIVLGLLIWWALFVSLSMNAWNPLGLLYVLGVPFMFILPGILTLLILKLTHLDIWSRIALSVGLSILEIMAIALLGNWLFPLFGVMRPLDTMPAVWEISTLVAVLLAFSWGDLKEYRYTVPKYIVGNKILDLVCILLSLVFLGLGILGAVRLNSGGDGIFTVIMLFGMGMFSVLLLSVAERLNKHIIPSVMYFMSLTLLLMTSLRGWFISGHDIQREFFVFQLAKNAGIWDPSTYVDAYNACLSITILPTVIANVLHMPDMYIYKVLFQVIFAVSLIVVYLISRTWLNNQLAFLAGIFFMAFPTFFQDMPFLLRQEVAFLFYGLLLYIAFEKHIKLYVRQILFVAFGVGVVLSHYSTTYTVLFILFLTIFAIPFVHFLVKKFMPSRVQSKAAVDVLAPGVFKEKRKIRFIMVVFLFVISVVWTSFITETDAHLRSVVGDVWTAVTEGFDGDVRSADVFVFFTLGRVSHEKTLDEYVEDRVSTFRANTPEIYFDEETYTAYPYTQLKRSVRETTELGNVFSVGGYSFGKMVSLFGSIFAKVMQLAIPIGMVYVLFRFAWVRRIDTEFYILAVASLIFIALCIVVPILSNEYGVFRAMQQSMFVLVPFMVVGTLVIGNWFACGIEKWHSLFGLHKEKVEYYSVRNVATFFGAVFFIYATGAVGQAVGGNVPPIHMNNFGDDYNHYVVERDEYDAIQWLNNRVQEDITANPDRDPPLVQADRFGTKKLRSVLSTPVAGDIYPGSIRKDSYVFIGPAIVHDRTAVLNYDNVLIKYTYPIEFLSENKELVYSNNGVRIYR